MSFCLASPCGAKASLTTSSLYFRLSRLDKKKPTPKGGPAKPIRLVFMVDISEHIAKCRMDSYIIKLGISIPKHPDYFFDIAGFSLIVGIEASIPAE